MFCILSTSAMTACISAWVPCSIFFLAFSYSFVSRYTCHSFSSFLFLAVVFFFFADVLPETAVPVPFASAVVLLPSAFLPSFPNPNAFLNASIISFAMPRMDFFSVSFSPFRLLIRLLAIFFPASSAASCAVLAASSTSFVHPAFTSVRRCSKKSFEKVLDELCSCSHFSLYAASSSADIAFRCSTKLSASFRSMPRIWSIRLSGILSLSFFRPSWYRSTCVSWVSRSYILAGSDIFFFMSSRNEMILS